MYTYIINMGTENIWAQIVWEYFPAQQKISDTSGHKLSRKIVLRNTLFSQEGESLKVSAGIQKNPFTWICKIHLAESCSH